MFKGSNVALITPFKNNKLDVDNYIELIHFHIKNGTNGLVPAGTTGESPTLTHEEHEKVIELCIKEAKGKIPVIAGTGSNSTAEAISLTKHAEKVGADGDRVLLFELGWSDRCKGDSWCRLNHYGTQDSARSMETR